MMREKADSTPRGALACALAAFAAALLAFMASPAAARQERREEQPRVADSVLGVRLGDRLREVHARLEGLGTVGGRDTRKGGRKEAWTFKGTDFVSLAYETDREGRVEWLTAFVRPGREIPFSDLGDLGRALTKSDHHANWSVEREKGKGYLLMLKGAGGKARVIHLIARSRIREVGGEKEPPRNTPPPQRAAI